MNWQQCRLKRVPVFKPTRIVGQAGQKVLKD